MTGWSVTLLEGSRTNCVATAMSRPQVWYGSAATPVACFGPTRYVWDLGLYIAGTAPNAKDVNVIDSVLCSVSRLQMAR